MKNSKRIARLMIALCMTASGLSWGWLPATAEAPFQYPEIKTASGFSRILQNVTGFTLVSGWVANHFLRKELREHVQGDLKSRLNLYSGSDLLGGKARKIRISGEDVLVENLLPISRFEFENKTDRPLYVAKNRHLFLLRPVEFKVSAVMTEDDLNRMLQSEQGRKRFTDMKVTVPPFGEHRMDLLNPKVDIQDSRIVIESLMNMHDAPPENALPIKVSGKIAAKKAQLKLSDLDIQVEGIQDTDEVARVIENYFSDLVNLERIKVDRHRVKVAIGRSELANNQLNLEATLTVEPNRKDVLRYLKSSKKDGKKSEKKADKR